MSKQYKLPIYDLYILNDGGMPIIAGCTGSDYCKSHSGEHPLHTGFINALQNFGDEVFSGIIRDLEFHNVKLNFQKVDNYSIVAVNPIDIEDTYIKNKLDEVAEIFDSKYKDKVKDYMQMEDIYSDFMDDMAEIGLLPRDRIKSTREFFITEKGEQEEQSSSMFEKFKNKFLSLIKR